MNNWFCSRLLLNKGRTKAWLSRLMGSLIGDSIITERIERGCLLDLDVNRRTTSDLSRDILTYTT